MASTFKPNGSLSSTDEINKKKDYKGLKSESEFILQLRIYQMMVAT